MIARVDRLQANVVGWLERQEGPLFRSGAATLLRLLTAIKSSAFSKNVSVMLVGAVLGQVLSVALSPVLTRVYSPVEFGALGVYMSALNILVGLAAFRYEIPMSTAPTETSAVNLLALCSGLLVVTTTVLGLTAFVLPTSAITALGLGSVDDARLLLPLGFAFLGGYYVMMYYATREQDFKAIARTRISQGVSGPLSQIGLGLLGTGVTGLIIGFVIGQSSGTLLLLKRTIIDRLDRLKSISLRGIWLEARRHRAFPLISSWASLIDTAGAGQLVYVLMALYYPGHIVGYMFIAERVVARPLLMVSTSLLTVFMGELGRSVSENPELLRRRFMQVSSRQFLFGLTWVIIADLLAIFAFPLIFGSAWADAVPYLVILSVVYLVNSVIGSVNYTLQVLGKQARAAVWQVGRVAAVTLTFVLSDHFALAPITAVGIYAMCQVAACLILFGMMKLSVDRLAVRLPMRSE